MQWQPWLFLIFAGTLLEYNRHRIAIFFVSGKTLHSGNHELIRKNQKKFRLAILILGIGMVAAVLSTRVKVLFTFLLFGVLTFFYSGIDSTNKKYAFKLREIPYLKIFLISFIWSVSTILIPVIQTDSEINNHDVFLLFSERFLFIFAIAIQFDIRDMQADLHSGLKTIPLKIGKKKSEFLSFFALSAGFLVSVFHYHNQYERFLLWPLGISFISTLLILNLRFFRNRSRFFYPALDATLLLQGILVLGFYFLNSN